MLTKSQISALYVALLGRAPDGNGLEYWYKNAANTTTENMATAMFNAAVENGQIADADDYETLINDVYNNILGREPDQKGHDYWLKELQNPESPVKPGTFVAAVYNAAKAEHPDDFAVLDAKAEAGVKVAEKIKSDDVNGDGKVDDADLKVFKDAVAQVKTKDDIAKAEEIANKYAPLNVEITSDKTSYEGNEGADTFKADLLDFKDGTTIDGKGGVDTLELSMNADITDATTIKNVENINFTGYGDRTIDMTNITGVKQFTTKNSTGKVNLKNVTETTVGFGFEGSNKNDIEADYKAGTLTGNSDKLNVSLNNAKDVELDVDSGFESFTITNKGDSSTKTLTVPGIDTIILKGDGSVNFAHDLDVKTFNASNFSGVVYTGKDNDNDGLAQNNIEGDDDGTSVLLGSGNDQIGFIDQADAKKSNTIKLGAGNDSLNVTTDKGYTYIFAEDGDDTVAIDDVDANDLVDLGAGNDTLTLTGDSTLVARGVENLTVKSATVDINSADSALKVNLVAEDDDSNLTITNLTAGSTVEVNAKKNTTNDVEILKVTYKNVEDKATIKVNTTVTAGANTDDMTIENVKNLTLDFAKAVNLDSTDDGTTTPDGELILNDKVETLTIKAADNFKVDAIKNSGTAAGLTTLTINGDKAVTTGDITDEDKLTTLKATAKDALSIGKLANVDKLKTIELTGKSVSLEQVGDNKSAETTTPDDLTATITAENGNVTFTHIGKDDEAAVYADKVSSFTVKAEKGSILVSDQHNDDDTNILLKAEDKDGIEVNLTAKTNIGDNQDDDGDGYGKTAGDDAATIANTKGNIDLTVAGKATASLIVKAGDGDTDYTNDTKGIVNLTATNTGGGAFDVYNDSTIDDEKTSTLNLGDAATNKINILKVHGIVNKLKINGGDGNDTVCFADPGNFANFKTATIDLGKGTNTLNVNGLDLQYAPDGTNLGTDNGVVANFSSDSITVEGTDGSSKEDDVKVESGVVKLYDATGDDENASNTDQRVVEKSWTIDTEGVTNFVGTAKADYIVANATGMTIDGGAGDDIITLGAGDDKVVFSGLDGSGNFTNGSDTISTFQTGDKYDFSSSLTGGAIANSTTAGGTITLASASDLQASGTSIGVAKNKVYIAEVTNKADVDSVGDLVSALTDGGVMDAVDVATSAHVYLIVGGADDDTTHYIYEINNDDTAAVVSSEVLLAGTVTTDITDGLDGLTTSNFVF